MVLMQFGLRNPDCKGAFLEILQSAREVNRLGKVILYYFDMVMKAIIGSLHIWL